ncbi:hypothetical protein FKM82_021281 [Ascaphus truei]
MVDPLILDIQRSAGQAVSWPSSQSVQVFVPLCKGRSVPRAPLVLGDPGSGRYKSVKLGELPVERGEVTRWDMDPACCLAF